MKNFSKALAVASALTATSAVLAQDTTNNGLAGLLGGAGIVGVAVLALIVFVVWRFFFNGD